MPSKFFPIEIVGPIGPEMASPAGVRQSSGEVEYAHQRLDRAFVSHCGSERDGGTGRFTNHATVIDGARAEKAEAVAMRFERWHPARSSA